MNRPQRPPAPSVTALRGPRSWRPPFFIPDLEASDVELHRQAARQPRPFHQQLLFRQDQAAGVARCPVTGATPR